MPCRSERIVSLSKQASIKCLLEHLKTAKRD